MDWSRKVPSIEATCKCTDIYQVYNTQQHDRTLIFWLPANTNTIHRKQKFRQGLKDVVAKKKATKQSNAGNSKAQRDGLEQDRLAEGKKSDAKTESWVLEASRSSRNVKKEAMRSSEIVKPELSMSLDHLCFYEVKCELIFREPVCLKSWIASASSFLRMFYADTYFVHPVIKDEVNPVYDYTVDYRRFSYVDFQVSDVVGSSTVLPELLAEWIGKAIPRNQDDVYPLFVLCKDLLRKFCLRETRYSFKVGPVPRRPSRFDCTSCRRSIQGAHWQQVLIACDSFELTLGSARCCKRLRGSELHAKCSQRMFRLQREEYLEKQVESLSQSLHECTEQSEKARASFEQITSQHVRELKSLQEQLNLAQTELLSAQQRVVGLEHGNKLLLRLVTALQPRCEFQVHELEARMSSIRDLEKTVDSMDSAFREVALEAEAGKQQAKAQIEELEAEVQRLDAFRVDAEERLATLSAALDKANRLNEEFLEHFNSVMARQPDEVVSGMTLEQKLLFFRALLRSPDNLIMQLEDQDLLSQTVLSLRYAVCLFLREIRSKSINYESWLDSISEALGCEPENLINNLLKLSKEAGRSAHLGAIDRYSPVWDFLKQEMERCNVEIDLDSFERLKEGDEVLSLKIVGSEVGSESSEEEGFIYNDRSMATGDTTNLAGSISRDSSAPQGVRANVNADSLQFGQTVDGAQGSRTIRSAHRHGHRPSSTKREIAAVRREEDYIVKKYGLFDMTELRGVKGFSIEDTIAMIGAIIDFKAESDYHCDLSIRPRLNMVKVVRMYLKQRCNKREVSDAELKSLCRSIVNLQARHSLVRIFGIMSGMIDTSHWTERSACFFIEAIRGVKSLDEPGAESEDPDALEEGWLMFRTWLSDSQHTLKRSTFVKGLDAACSGMFGFGPMPDLVKKLETASVAIAGADPIIMDQTNAEVIVKDEDSDADVYLHSALEVVCAPLHATFSDRLAVIV